MAEIGLLIPQPKLNAHVTLDPATANSNNNNNQREKTEGSPMWTDTWMLLMLQALALYGPPIIVFSFEWLRSCPSLRTMDLATDHFRPQRVSLSWKSPSARLLPRTMESPLVVTKPTRRNTCKKLRLQIATTTRHGITNTYDLQASRTTVSYVTANWRACLLEADLSYPRKIWCWPLPCMPPICTVSRFHACLIARKRTDTGS